MADSSARDRAIETVDAELLSLAPFTWQEHSDLARLAVDALRASPDVLAALAADGVGTATPADPGESDAARTVIQAARFWKSKRDRLQYPPPRLSSALDGETCSIPEARALYDAVAALDSLTGANKEAPSTASACAPREPRERQEVPQPDPQPVNEDLARLMSAGVTARETDLSAHYADEPRHEVSCPQCGATIRARMADAAPPLRGDSPERDADEVAHDGLRQAREEAHLSIRDLATAAGVAPMTVQRADKGLPIRPSSYRAISSVLAVPAHPGVARPEPGSLAPCGKCRWTQPYISITHGCPEHDDDGESW